MKYVRVEHLQDRYGYHLDPQRHLQGLPQISGNLPTSRPRTVYRRRSS